MVEIIYKRFIQIHIRVCGRLIYVYEIHHAVLFLRFLFWLAIVVNAVAIGGGGFTGGGKRRIECFGDAGGSEKRALRGGGSRFASACWLSERGTGRGLEEFALCQRGRKRLDGLIHVNTKDTEREGGVEKRRRGREGRKIGRGNTLLKRVTSHVAFRSKNALYSLSSSY
jgi:hypothetical protein